MNFSYRKAGLIGLVFLFGVSATYVVYQIVRTASRTGPENDDASVTSTGDQGSSKNNKDEKNKDGEKDEKQEQETVWEVEPTDDLSPEERVKNVVQALKKEEPDEKIVSRQTGVLVRLGKRALPAVKTVIDHEDQRIRTWAVRTIGEVFVTGNPTAPRDRRITLEDVESVFRQRLKDESSSTVRVAVVRALGKTENPMASEVLKVALEKDPSEEVRKAARFARIQVD